MEKWQQEFAQRVGALREQWAHAFANFAKGTLAPVFKQFAEFTQRLELQATQVQGHDEMYSYKFSLCEDAYVLLYFRPRGVDLIEFDYECFVPGAGRVAGVKSSASARSAEKHWVEACFRMALDDLVTRFTERDKTRPANRPQEEPVLVA